MLSKLILNSRGIILNSSSSIPIKNVTLRLNNLRAIPIRTYSKTPSLLKLSPSSFVSQSTAAAAAGAAGVAQSASTTSASTITPSILKRLNPELISGIKERFKVAKGYVAKVAHSAPVSQVIPYTHFHLSLSRILFALASTGLVLYHVIYHSERVPITGRWRMDWMPKILEDGFVAASDTHIFGETADARLPAENKLHSFVMKIGDKLTNANHLKRLTYHVVQRDIPNAFVTPGGHVYVFTGLFEVVEKEDDLGIILGHEIAHKVAKHTIDGLLLNLFINLFRLLLDYNSDLLENFASIALTLPFSRSHELEADHIGLIFAARAGYDPERAEILWTKMLQLEEKYGGDPGSYGSTHPATEVRIHNFQKGSKWMEEAKKEQALMKQSESLTQNFQGKK